MMEPPVGRGKALYVKTEARPRGQEGKGSKTDGKKLGANSGKRTRTRERGEKPRLKKKEPCENCRLDP